MRKDSRLSRMLHVLLHMAQHNKPLTSEQLACMLDTNAVVVRRTMAGLRQAGYVSSGKGHGGGWSIHCDLKQVTLLDIHQAVGGPRIFAIGNEKENPDCGVEKVVNAALETALTEAETLLINRLGSITLDDLASHFNLLCQPSHQEARISDCRHLDNQPAGNSKT